MSERQAPLVFAMPKGRLLDQLSAVWDAAGIDSAPFSRRSRRLIRDDTDAGLRYLLLKPDDVPTYVEYGVAHLGVVGRDVLLEREYDLYAPLDLGIGRCRLCVAGRPDARLDGHPLRVATKYPNIAAKHFESRRAPVEIIFVQGSVELAPLTGLADVIVDIVESGETLKQNGLVVLEDVEAVSAVVVANRVGLKIEQERVRALLQRLASRGG